MPRKRASRLLIKDSPESYLTQWHHPDIPSQQAFSRRTQLYVRNDEICEEIFISTNILYNLLMSYLSVPVLLQLHNKQVVKSCSVVPLFYWIIIIGHPDLWTGSQQSLCNDGSQWFIASAAFPIPAHSKKFCRGVVERTSLDNLFTERLTTALFWWSSLIPAQLRKSCGRDSSVSSRGKIVGKFFHTTTGAARPEFK